MYQENHTEMRGQVLVVVNMQKMISNGAYDVYCILGTRGSSKESASRVVLIDAQIGVGSFVRIATLCLQLVASGRSVTTATWWTTD